jgi:hypothetical protein
VQSYNGPQFGSRRRKGILETYFKTVQVCLSFAVSCYDCRKKTKNKTKLSRESTNLDLMRRLMLTSDPVISSLRELLKKSRGSLPSAVLALLEAPPSLTSGASASTSATQNIVAAQKVNNLILPL